MHVTYPHGVQSHPDTISSNNRLRHSVLRYYKDALLEEIVKNMIFDTITHSIVETRYIIVYTSVKYRGLFSRNYFILNQMESVRTDVYISHENLMYFVYPVSH